MHFHILSAAADAAAAAAAVAAAAAGLCVAILRLLLQQLLLFVIVCRMAKIVAGLLNLIPSSVFFLFIQIRFIFNVCTYPLAVPVSYTHLTLPTILRV